MANRLPELPLEPRELILVTVAFVLAGLLLMATGALGALGKLRPNPLMGIRTPLTMRDPKPGRTSTASRHPGWRWRGCPSSSPAW